MSEIASESVARCLAYVWGVSGQGGSVTAEELNAYAEATPPEYRLADASHFDHSEFYEFTPSMSDYLKRLGWVRASDGLGFRNELVVTPLGVSVATQLMYEEENSRESRDFAIAMQPESTLDYMRFVSHLNGLGDDILIVDRYLAAAAVGQLAHLIGVTRILTTSVKTSTDRSPESRRGEILAGLAVTGGTTEVRTLDDVPSPLHDRLVLPESGKGLLLGGSLGGKQVNTVVTLSEGMTIDLRSKHMEHWTRAIPVAAEADSEPASAKG